MRRRKSAISLQGFHVVTAPSGRVVRAPPLLVFCSSISVSFHRSERAFQRAPSNPRNAPAPDTSGMSWRGELRRSVPSHTILTQEARNSVPNWGDFGQAGRIFCSGLIGIFTNSGWLLFRHSAGRVEATVSNDRDTVGDAAVLLAQIQAVPAHVVVDDAGAGGGGSIASGFVEHARQKEERIAGREVESDPSLVVLAFVHNLGMGAGEGL